MPQEEHSCTILFADISGSTSLYASLGDESAHKLVSACIAVLTRVIAQHGGTLIKTIGDEVMCTFPEAECAVKAAGGMHMGMDCLPPVLPGKPIRPNVRIGMHTGPVIRQAGDVFGDAVNVAARMASLAKPRQTIATGQVLAALPPSCTVNSVCVDRTTVKGKGGEFNLYELIWEEDSQTVILSTGRSPDALGGRLRVRLGDQEACVNKDRPSITLGRQAQNDLVVDDAIASRVHARIEYQRGRFVLVDVSANGTYVQMEGTEPVFIRHEELVLGTGGIIALGRTIDRASPQVIAFTYFEG